MHITMFRDSARLVSGAKRLINGVVALGDSTTTTTTTHSWPWLPKKFSTQTGNVDVSGIFPPIITPFNADGKISYKHLQQNMKRWNEIPFKGYVVLGSNGESVSLSDVEKLELLRQVRSLANSSHVIIAGTGCHGTQATIELCVKVAEDKSADAVLVITPSFYKNQMNNTALRAHFETVADKSPLPVILYSVPANTNVDLNPELVSDLASHPNIIGLKDSGGEIAKISRIIHETKGRDFQVMAGSAGFLLPALMMGCVGGVCALANVLGKEVCELDNLYRKNNLESAISLQRKLILPNFLVTGKFGVAGLKATMDLAGFYGGPCRTPLLPLEPSEMKQLKEGFAKEGFKL